jgi:hypothetical protein
MPKLPGAHFRNLEVHIPESLVENLFIVDFPNLDLIPLDDVLDLVLIPVDVQDPPCQGIRILGRG